MAPAIAPFGSWKSPLSARMIAEGATRLFEPMLLDGAAWWVEMRPKEGGRYVVVRRDAGGRMQDVVPAPFNARTRVHEYGGGACLPVADGVFFVHFADQRLYRIDGTGAPKPVTPDGRLRYADFVWDAQRSRLIAVEEDHRAKGECVNRLAAVYPNDGGRSVTLAEGRDFYSSPRLSPDGSQFAWLEWNHPDMPWDAAGLHVATVRADGSLGKRVRVAGGPKESCAQPEWSPDGVLHFVSDRTDWWNLYRYRSGRVEQLTDLEAEFTHPQWVFRMSFYDFDGPRRIVCAYAKDAVRTLATLDTRTLRLTTIETPYTAVGYLRVSGGRAIFVGGAPDRPSAVVTLDLATGRTEELRRASAIDLDRAYISAPESVEFPTTGGLTAHGVYYPPRNPDFAAPEGEKPPLMVMVHGGPISVNSCELLMGVQYYTSRGIAVFDVNYGGSTSYGRKYRERLYGRWGVVDVDDACSGAKFLAEAGRVDGKRLGITGGSAGGYTVLSCLAFRKVFAAGASHFGVSDCEALAKDSHKFESHDLDRLIAPYPARRDVYVERSPIHHVDGLSCPVIFFQGLEDKIVPPDQAERMVAALRKKGLPVAYVAFAGEQHGFRKSENILRAIEDEFYFFSRIFRFTPADALEPVPIENL